jgi:hypothetical protein
VKIVDPQGQEVAFFGLDKVDHVPKLVLDPAGETAGGAMLVASGQGPAALVVRNRGDVPMDLTVGRHRKGAVGLMLGAPDEDRLRAGLMVTPKGQSALVFETDWGHPGRIWLGTYGPEGLARMTLRGPDPLEPTIHLSAGPLHEAEEDTGESGPPVHGAVIQLENKDGLIDSLPRAPSLRSPHTDAASGGTTASSPSQVASGTLTTSR